jgi:hypothetical protein
MLQCTWKETHSSAVNIPKMVEQHCIWAGIVPSSSQTTFKTVNPSLWAWMLKILYTLQSSLIMLSLENISHSLVVKYLLPLWVAEITSTWKCWKIPTTYFFSLKLWHVHYRIGCLAPKWEVVSSLSLRVCVEGSDAFCRQGLWSNLGIVLMNEIVASSVVSVTYSFLLGQLVIKKYTSISLSIGLQPT